MSDQLPAPWFRRCRLCGLMCQRTTHGTPKDGLAAHRYVVHGIRPAGTMPDAEVVPWW